MIAPENMTGASIDGCQYKVKKGKIKVAREHVSGLCLHGFLVDSDQSDESLEDDLKKENSFKPKSRKKVDFVQAEESEISKEDNQKK